MKWVGAIIQTIGCIILWSLISYDLFTIQGMMALVGMVLIGTGAIIGI